MNGPDTMVIYEDERDISVMADYTKAYGSFVEVRTNASREQLAEVAESLREIAENIEKYWRTFDAMREGRASSIRRVVSEFKDMSEPDRNEVMRLLNSASTASDDIAF